MEDTGLVRFLLHESKLKCMPERKVLNSLLWKTFLNGCKLRLKTLHKSHTFCMYFHCLKGFFGQKSRKLTEYYQNFLCTWKSFFPHIFLSPTVCMRLFQIDHPNVYMLIFQWESEFRGSKGDKSNVEGLGEQWERQPQGQGWVHFFHIFASCIVQLDLWNGFCHPCNLKIRIFIEKLAYKHVSHAYLKKIYYYFPVLVPWNSILYCIIWGGGAKKNIP